MKHALAFAFALLLLGATGASAQKTTLKTQKDSTSYGLGVQLGQQIYAAKEQIDVDRFIAGIRDRFDGKAKLSDAEAMELVQTFQKQMAALQQQKAAAAATDNIAAEKHFLDSNRKAEGVHETASGLQYRILTPGTGPSPTDSSTVTVDYTGTLPDGTVFDSSVERGKPATFPVNGVISGWTEALQLMKEGAKWQLFIPAKLAYGERGAGQQIGPNQMLIFDVQLLKVND